MLQHAIRLKMPLTLLLSEMAESQTDDQDFIITLDEWKIFQLLGDFLSFFKEATLLASGDTYPTLSLVVPLYKSLLNHTQSVVLANEDNQTLQNAARACLENLEAYYDISSESCIIAT